MIALGAGLAIWGAINLLEGYGNDNPGAKSQGMKQLMAGGMGQNDLRSLFTLGFQAFLIIVCVAIYAVLVQTISISGDLSAAMWSCMGYTVLLCFSLFKTSSLAKSVFNAH